MVANQASGGSADSGNPSSVSSSSKSSSEPLQTKNALGQVLTLETMNPHVMGFRKLEYAARGPIIKRAMELEREVELAKKNGKTPKFPEIIKMNLGDAHAMGQKPITFLRQVLALISCPDLIEQPQFKDDVKRKAREILASCRGGSAGAYSDSRGMLLIRQHVAKYIEERDGGHPSSADDIVLSAGASEGIRACLKLLKTGENSTNQKRAGILCPVPEYPLYSASLEEFNIAQVNYYMDEHLTGWEVNVQHLEEIVKKSKDSCEPKAVVIINPGNPTGHVLNRENIEDIIRFAYKEHLMVIADEVYQNNVYGEKKFVSFKKVLREMAPPFNSVELISVHSGSKGYTCECGLRAGYFEVCNMDPEVKSVLTATVAANLCPTVLGQAVIDCLVSPPTEQDPSFKEYNEEKSGILNSLAARAQLVYEELNSIPGISCARLDGSMYAYPQIHLPEKAVAEAREKEMEPDVLYCLDLLNTTGICVVPGSGMGQQPGTYHFRTTILASTDKMKMMLETFRNFHLDFVKRYS